MVRDLTDRPRVGRADPHGVLGWSRHILPRVISYLTNDVINRIPVFRIRHAWYRSVLGLKMGHGTAVYRGCYMTHYGPRSVRTSHSSIGCNTIINRDCTIDVRGTLTIGSNVSISPEVAILTAQHQYNSPTFALEHRDVVIGDNVWIGMRAMILPGAQIGHGAVVAAGAVVTGRVPPLTLVAGVPARPIAARDEEAARYFFDSPPVLFE